jgi:hypothetical protein
VHRPVIAWVTVHCGYSELRFDRGDLSCHKEAETGNPCQILEHIHADGRHDLERSPPPGRSSFSRVGGTIELEPGTVE